MHKIFNILTVFFVPFFILSSAEYRAPTHYIVTMALDSTPKEYVQQPMVK